MASLPALLRRADALPLSQRGIVRHVVASRLLAVHARAFPDDLLVPRLVEVLRDRTCEPSHDASVWRAAVDVINADTDHRWERGEGAPRPLRDASTARTVILVLALEGRRFDRTHAAMARRALGLAGYRALVADVAVAVESSVTRIRTAARRG